jgi:7-keto-8-aminopelargonate synthetase-like enzyme
LLYATGWQAGFGAIQALIRPEDHVVIDKLAHACLNTGVIHSTRNVHKFAHNDLVSLEESLKAIRKGDVHNAILVVSEGLYSMDSDVPPLCGMQDLVHRYGATLLVDIAHDFGSMGPGGTGSIGAQGMLGKVDLVMGSFSKTFACNGGFLICPKAAKDHIQLFSSSYIFSNALSPIQCAVALECLNIVRSEDGDTLRAKLMAAVNILRKSFQDRDFKVAGIPSAIVPALVYDEGIARIMGRLLNEAGVLSNLCEYPAVPRGLSRFRFQVMATHTARECQEAVRVFAKCHEEAEQVLVSV